MKELLEKIIFYALQYNATDIHFYFQTDVSIRFRIFGELVDYTKIDEEGDKLMNYIKYQASINTNYKLLAQTGQFHIDMDKKRYELRDLFYIKGIIKIILIIPMFLFVLNFLK